MTKKILHIGKYYPPFMGGIETFMGHLLPELNTAGVENTVLCHHHVFAHPHRRETIDTVRIERVKSFGRILFAPISPGFGVHLKRLIKELNPDLIHIHLPNTSAFWLISIAAGAKIPWVIHWHSDVSTPGFSAISLLYPFYRQFEQALCRRSQAIICTSPAYQQSSPALAKWQDKCRVIPLGIPRRPPPPYTNTPTSSSSYWQTNNKKVLAIGRLTHYKGFNYLIQAMQYLDDDYQLLIVGQGELFAQLQQQILNMGLHNRILLAGHVPEQELQILKQQCDLFCLPSIARTEAFGMVLLEMMAAKKPIVVSRVKGSGMNWVVQDNDSALFAEAQNPKQLAEKIMLTMNNPDDTQKRVEQAYQRFQENFVIDKVAEKVSGLYRELV